LRIPGLRSRFTDDPYLKVGVAAMAVALAFAGVVVFIVFLEEPERAVAAKSATESTTEPLVRSDPGIDPWVESERGSPGSARRPESGSGRTPGLRGSALAVDETDYPLPTNQQVEAAHEPRHYDLPQGAIMLLTIESIGLYSVPVLDSESSRALDHGVIHLPDTSLPWSDTPERNVYLAGHRLGWPGTGSHLMFYRLGALANGDEISLKDTEGRIYEYRVIDTFQVNPEDSWVTGRVRGRDLLTLQTCTPIPTFEKRLIVRAERI
jgi:sortase A